jgi:Radial spokehead-like protein
MTSFEEARQQLQKESSDGVSLYDHLSEVLLKVLSDKTGNASEAFEQISIDVKQARHQAQQPVQTSSRAAAKSAQLKWATNAQVCEMHLLVSVALSHSYCGTVDTYVSTAVTCSVFSSYDELYLCWSAFVFKATSPKKHLAVQNLQIA